MKGATDSVRQKIQKLRALTVERGATQGEAANAAELADKLELGLIDSDLVLIVRFSKPGVSPAKIRAYNILNWSRCRRCNAEIAWVITHNGKRMPVDRVVGDDGYHVSHFVACPPIELERRAR